MVLFNLNLNALYGILQTVIKNKCIPVRQSRRQLADEKILVGESRPNLSLPQLIKAPSFSPFRCYDVITA